MGKWSAYINMVSEAFSCPFWYHLALCFFSSGLLYLYFCCTCLCTHTQTHKHVSAPLTQTHTHTHFFPTALFCSTTFPSLSPSLYPIVSWLWTAFPPCVNRRLVCVAGPAAASSRQGFLPSVYLACYRRADVYLQEWIQNPDTPSSTGTDATHPRCRWADGSTRAEEPSHKLH